MRGVWSSYLGALKESERLDMLEILEDRDGTTYTIVTSPHRTRGMTTSANRRWQMPSLIASCTGHTP